MGEGLYAWETREQADRYLEMLQSREGAPSDLVIVEHHIRGEDFDRLRSADMTTMDDDAATELWNSGGDHDYEQGHRTVRAGELLQQWGIPPVPEQDSELTQHTRRGEYKLQRQHAGVGYFGQVKVGAASSSEASGSTVEWAVPADDRTSVQPRSDSEFVAAAVAGARLGIELVAGLGAELGEEVRGCRIDVLHVQVNLIDIEESAVRAAAALAVADAFEVVDRFELRFDGGWQVEPTPWR